MTALQHTLHLELPLLTQCRWHARWQLTEYLFRGPAEQRGGARAPERGSTGKIDTDEGRVGRAQEGPEPERGRVHGRRGHNFYNVERWRWPESLLANCHFSHDVTESFGDRVALSG